MVLDSGVWEEVDGKLIPTGGMAHYISPPHTVLNLITDPFHTLFYLVFVLSACKFRSVRCLLDHVPAALL